MASEGDERLTTLEYVPRKFIEEYTDPYPKYELVQARAALIKGVCDWSERKGTSRLKEKLGIPEEVDTRHVMFLLERDQGMSIGPPSYNWKSDRSSNQLELGPNRRQKPSCASGTPHQSNVHMSSSGSFAKRKSDNLIVGGEEKRPCQESVRMSGRATAGNLIVVSPKKQEKEVRKRAISPMKAIEPGKSVLNITTINSTSSRSVDKPIPKIPLPSTSSASAISIVSEASSLGSSASASSSSASAESSRKVSGTTSSVKNTPVNDFEKEGPKTVEDVQVSCILQCDYCEHVENTANKPNMQSHLKSFGHYSASIYGVKKTGKKNVELVDVKKRLYVVEHSAQFQSYVVRCPECGEIFGDVFQCGLHYRFKHCQIGVMEKYALAKVSGIKVAEYTTQNVKKCLVCNETFVSLKKLNLHEVNRGHLPFEKVDRGKNDCLLLFMNDLNYKIAINNYHLMKAHIASHFERKKNEGLSVKMFVHTVQINESFVRSLPPLAANSTTLNIVRNDIAIWKTIIKFHRERFIGQTTNKSDKEVMAHLEALCDNIMK